MNRLHGRGDHEVAKCPSRNRREMVIVVHTYIFPLVHNVGIAKSSTSGRSTDLRCRCSLGQVRLPIEKYLTEDYASAMDENSFVSDLKFRSTDITSISRGVSCPFQDRRLGISLPFTVLSRICMTTWYLRLHSLDWTICRLSRVERYASLNSLGISEMSTSTNHEVFSHDRPVRLRWDAIVGHILVFCSVICLCEMIRVSKSLRRRILHKFQSETVGNYVLWSSSIPVLGRLLSLRIFYNCYF